MIGHQNGSFASPVMVYWLSAGLSPFDSKEARWRAHRTLKISKRNKLGKMWNIWIFEIIIILSLGIVKCPQRVITWPFAVDAWNSCKENWQEVLPGERCRAGIGRSVLLSDWTCCQVRSSVFEMLPGSLGCCSLLFGEHSRAIIELVARLDAPQSTLSGNGRGRG